MPPRLRSRALERTIIGLLALAFLLLMAIVGATGWMIKRTERDNGEIDRSYQVRTLADSILAGMIDAETGQRGYLLTGDQDYLVVARGAPARLHRQLERLQRLVAGDPGQQARVADLSLHIDREHAELKRGMDLYNAGRPNDALALVRTNVGHQEMRRIRGVVAEIDAKEAGLLIERRRSAEIANERTLAANSASSVLIIVLGVVVLYLVWRYVQELRASRAELDVINRGLEGIVAERTAELVAANTETGKARDRAEAMLREVNHRVANSLHIVSSFVHLQTKALTDEAAKGALQQTLARIEAVSQIHRRLYTSADVESVELNEYLSALADELQKSLVPPGRPVRIRAQADPARAPTDRAVALGVIVAELVTNAVKYAYGEGEAGEIRVKLRVEDPARALLTVEDDGRGMGQGPPEGTGVGGRILDAMAQTVGSKVDYDLTGRGVRARLAFAL